MFDPVANIDLLMDAAKKAPSVLNTQPWLFRIVANDRIDLHAHPDPERRLKSIDPNGRERVISCGAALFNLRLALRVAGHDPVVWLMPDERNRPDLLASVEIVTTRVHPPTTGEQQLYEAIWQRRTNRQPFDNERVGLNMVAELEHEAWKERVYLLLLDRRKTQTLLDALKTANARVSYGNDLADPEWRDKYRAELREYTSEDMLKRRLGIPPAAFGPLPENGRHFRHHRDKSGGPPDSPLNPPLDPGVPYRDFGFEWKGQREQKPFEKRPRLLALLTDANTRLDWLRAGQGLQRVLLTATQYNLMASFYTQPLEPSNEPEPASQDQKQAFSDLPWWPWPKFPQMIMRIGRPTVLTEETPRLDTGSVWTDDRKQP